MARTLVAIGVCYIAMNLALKLMWDIRNGPFVVANEYPWQKLWDDGRSNKCVNIADGGSLAFTLLFGWVYAAVYTGCWEIAWHHYHKDKTKLIDPNFKKDVISKTMAALSYLIIALIALAIVLVPSVTALLDILEKWEIIE